MSESDGFTNKSFKPPVFKEKFPINAYDLFKREPGSDPFKDNSYEATAYARFLRGARRVELKIQRAVELYASQILTTGTVTLTDSTGASIYTLDYKPKTANFAAAGTAWDNSSAVDIYGDIEDRAAVIRANSGKDVKRLLCGNKSFQAMTITNTAIKALYDSRRMDLGSIVAPRLMNSGGTYHGTISVADYEYELWTYGATYKHPETGASTKYLPDDKVVFLPDDSDLDFRALFGNIPSLAPPDSRVLRYLPSQISDVGNIRMHWNAWLNEDATSLIGGVSSRPLLLPASIDAFGCIDTGV